MMWSVLKKRNEIRISSKYYLLVKDRWAKKMNALTAGLSRRSLILLLIVFVVLMGLLCTYHIVKGFLFTKSSFQSIEMISMPKNKRE